MKEDKVTSDGNSVAVLPSQTSRKRCESTKIVLTGDSSQIDNPYLDASTNGLTFLAAHCQRVARLGDQGDAGDEGDRAG